MQSFSKLVLELAISDVLRSLNLKFSTPAYLAPLLSLKQLQNSSLRYLSQQVLLVGMEKVEIAQLLKQIVSEMISWQRFVASGKVQQI